MIVGFTVSNSFKEVYLYSSQFLVRPFEDIGPIYSKIRSATFYTGKMASVKSGNDVTYPICALCKGYLSRGPVRNNADGTIYHCGRCITDDPTVNIRNFAYEHLAQHMTFPCIYANCTVKAKWKNVEQHELVCPHKTMICPVPDCTEEIEAMNVVTHFYEYHEEKIVINSFNVNWYLNDPSYLFVGLLIHNQIPYILIIYNCEIRMRVSLHSIHNATTKKYKLTLSIPFSRELLIGEQDITTYNNKRHCVNCYIDECTFEKHNGPKASSSTDDTDKGMTTLLSLDTIQSIFQSELVSITVSIEMTWQEVFNTIIDTSEKIKCPFCKMYVLNCSCKRTMPDVWNNAKLLASVYRPALKVCRELLFN